MKREKDITEETYKRSGWIAVQAGEMRKKGYTHVCAGIYSDKELLRKALQGLKNWKGCKFVQVQWDEPRWTVVYEEPRPTVPASIRPQQNWLAWKV